jgi:amidohydrolase
MVNYTLPQQEEIIKYRQKLHQLAEVSGLEIRTSEQIAEYLEQFKPDQLLRNVGGTGVIAVFKGAKAGASVLFRAELDALPIAESCDLPYVSENELTGHKCGHDGHMAILLGLASLLADHRPNYGSVTLLFQPAEETGAGAWAMLQDQNYKELASDYVFALHNLPGYPMHQVVVKNDVFSAASTGLKITLQGTSSHAAEPEKGNSPAAAMSEIILAWQLLTADPAQFKTLTLLTVIHARLGEVAFGTNPGFATLMATLRSYSQQDFDDLKAQTLQAAQKIAANYNLKLSYDFVEEFPATVNDSEATTIVASAAESLGLDVIQAEQPFRWSEDFGWFTKQTKGALFGLGSGLTQPQLHHADYDFPDDLIATGSHLFFKIAQEVLQH